MSTLEIRLLGQIELVLGGDSITELRSDKALALLSYLSVESDQAHRREKISGLLWPDYPEGSARTNLRRALADLRRAINDEGAQPPYLNVSRQTIQFNTKSDAWVDVNQFARYSRSAFKPDQIAVENWGKAIEIYRGAFMEGFSLPDSQEFEQWLLITREHFQRRMLETLHRITEQLGESGEIKRALPYAWRQLEIDPSQESAHRQVMRLLALNGQRSAAINQYRSCVQILTTELGVDPSPETQKLYEQLLKGEWPLTEPAEVPISPRVPREIGPCPYRGLSAFQEEDSIYFFGREQFTSKLLDSIQNNALLTVILGSSGSGKSSIVYAGLIPKLREKQKWLITNYRPGSQPFYALAGAVLPLLEGGLSQTDHLIESNKLASALNHGELSLNVLIDRMLEVNPEATNLLLFIDQFEELYTLCTEPATRQRFLGEILSTHYHTASKPDSHTTILITIRADFMGQALAYRPFADAMQDNALMLGPMSRGEMQAAIEKPAEIQGAAFESGLVDRILDDVGEEPGNLPLLEFALTLLWEQAEHGWLTHSGYERIGQVEGALARYADRVYAELGDDDRERARQVFIQLVRPGEGTEDTRRIARQAEIGDENWQLVQYLADKRLVVTGMDASGKGTVEVAHETLIANWGRLQGWIDHDRAFRTWQEGLRSVIRKWENTARDEGGLLRGLPLAEAEAWLAEREGQLSDTELDYIQRSIEVRERVETEREEQHQRELATARQLAKSERRRRNMLLALAGVLSVAVIITLVLSIFSTQQRRQALEAYSVSLAANAQKALDENDHATALALAMAAAEIENPPDQVKRVLMDAAYSPGAREIFIAEEIFPGLGGSATVVEFSPDGQVVLFGLADGRIILWDLDSHAELGRFTAHSGQINDLAFTPDGTLAVSGGEDGLVIVWDISTGAEMRRFTGHSGPVRTVDIDQSGNLVVSGGYGGKNWDEPGELILWDLGTGVEIKRFEGHVSGIVAAEFCLEEQAILSSSGDANLFSSMGSTGDVAGAERNFLDLLLWDIESGSVINNFESRQDDAYTLSVSPDGERALVGSFYTNTLSYYDLRSGQLIHTLEGHSDAVRVVNFAGKGLAALSGANDGTLVLWNLSTGESFTRMAIHSGEVLAIGITPDERKALSSAGDGSLILWDLVDFEEIRRLYGHADMVYDVAFTAEGERMITASGGGELGGGSQDTSVRMWDLKSGRQLQKMDIPLPVLMQVAANPQGKDILFTGIGPVVFRFELDNWEQVDELVGHQGFYTPCIEFLPEGSKALSCSADGTLILWNLQNNQPILQLDGRDQGNGLWAVAISPDGLTALSDSGECSMILWDLETGKELRCFLRDDYSTRRGSSGIAFLPDGKTVISAESDNQLIEWDLETGEEIRRLGEHPSLRTRVVISPDGRFAVTSGMDGRLMVWDLARGTLVRQSDQHGVIFDLTMSPDGESVYFGSSNTTITEWGISNPSIDELKGWIEQNRYLRELTCAEREFYQVEPLCETKRVD